jgi:histidinol-phosphate aminotransferase
MSRYFFTNVAANLPSTVPFVGPEAQERARGEPFRARIGANECVFGPSPKAIAAMALAAAESWCYGDPENYDIKRALAEYYQISPDNIIVGEGIDALFGYTARLFVEPGTVVATSLGAYPTFNYQVSTCGGRIVTVPYRNDQEDTDALIALSVAENARLIYLANPDNPMGSWWDAETVQNMIDSVPECALLCLDEAYLEFAPPGTAPALDVNNDKVLRFRTFSKAYGLAGCRIGYAIGEAELIQSFDKLRNHFGVNRIAQAAALAALADQEYVESVIQKVSDARARISTIATAHDLIALPSAANFVAIDCCRDGDFARRILANLSDNGVFIRMPSVSPQDRCIRVTAGATDDLDAFEEALPNALYDAKTITEG